MAHTIVHRAPVTKCIPKRQDLKKKSTENIIVHDVREGKSLVRRWNGHRYNHGGEWAYWGRWWRITQSQRKQGKFQSRSASLYTWLTYDKNKNKMYCSKCISIGVNNTMTTGCDNFKTSSLTIGMQLVQITRFIASRIAQNCWISFSGRGAPIPRPNGPLLLMLMGQRPIIFKS